jgi:hypothetical protein
MVLYPLLIVLTSRGILANPVPAIMVGTITNISAKSRRAPCGASKPETPPFDIQFSQAIYSWSMSWFHMTYR